MLPGLTPFLLFFVCPNLARREYIPRRERHALAARHRDDLALELALEHAPLAGVDREWRLAVVACVLVRAGDDPCGRVGGALGGREGVEYMLLEALGREHTT